MDALFFVCLFLFLFIFSSFIHMCIQCLGDLFPRPPLPPSLPSNPPSYKAETILPLSPILLKREYKQ
jgi:hypothetical protein